MSIIDKTRFYKNTPTWLTLLTSTRYPLSHNAVMLEAVPTLSLVHPR